MAEQALQPPALPGQWAHFMEPLGPGLNQFFIVKVGGRDWIGRKVLQKNDKGLWKSSSIIEPDMLFGRLGHLHWSNEGVECSFLTASATEKHRVFARALTRAGNELYFPFPVLETSGQEFTCPADYWQCNPSLASRLDAEEEHFRQHCIRILKTLTRPGATLYDPACSTGTFIASLATALPGRRCVGADCSASMIRHASARHRAPGLEFYLMDATRGAVAGLTCDVLILRFLNAEVVTRATATRLLVHLCNCLNPGAKIIVFGHTPVLPDIPLMARQLGLTLLSCVAARPGRTELFQFYLLQAPAP